MQIVYGMLCDDALNKPPNPEEHWEGWISRNIVKALCGRSQPETTNFLPNLVDWVYLHATEGNVWPSSKTAQQLIALARTKPATQAEADAIKNGAPFPVASTERP